MRNRLVKAILISISVLAIKLICSEYNNSYLLIDGKISLYVKSQKFDLDILLNNLVR